MNSRVDVLAVLDRVLQYPVEDSYANDPCITSIDARGLREARDAVAELIEAAKECEARLAIHIKHTEDLVAHMRICAALSRIGAD